MNVFDLATIAGLGLLAFSAAVLLATVRLSILPAMTLWLVVLVPFGYMDLPREWSRYLTLPILMVLLWQLRVLLTREASQNNLSRASRTGSAPVIPAIVVICCLLASSLVSIDPLRSAMWVMVFAIAILLPLLSAGLHSHTAITSVETTFALIACWLGAFALAEFVTGVNPWDTLYTYEVANRSWVVFRAKTSLGHPLLTSAVCSTALVLCLFSTRARRPLFILATVFSLAGVVLAVSRTGVLAVVAGVIVAHLMSTRGVHGIRWPRVLFALGLSAVIVASPLLSVRSETASAVRSSEYRFMLFDLTAQLVKERPLLGYGPGTSGFAFERVAGSALENSALQLVISLGLVGVLSLGLLAFSWIRRFAIPPSVAGATVALLVSFIGFNAVDANPSLLALFAPLLSLALPRRVSTRSSRLDESPARRRGRSLA